VFRSEKIQKIKSAISFNDRNIQRIHELGCPAKMIAYLIFN